MNTQQYKVEAGRRVDLADWPTHENKDAEADHIKKQLKKTIEELKKWHIGLHAEEEKGIVVALQAMDAAGKDEAITYLFSNLTAQGLRVTTLGKPTEEELKHDYLWRLHKALPERGQIGILNRSHYEEVIATRVHNLLDDEPLPDQLIDGEVWKRRYRQINEFERYMFENGFPFVKFFFNISKEEQTTRLLERMKNPEKNWEFSFSDVEEREHWKDYQDIFGDMLTHTSTDHAPWYILPADDEMYSRLIIARVMVEMLEEINPELPEISGEQKDKLKHYIDKLEQEAK
ncbi:polyphosphate--nucleotide phosphotransferase [Planococcus sp. CP5-4]|uniref:PPK2 family polyphosphate kinase n=1 Tax=unclassified Planococcus (in: firmicutes) TaxID=2662419 RepID=UPI001C224184|nr:MULTISPECIES: PPK2 family polyphosphate kinase [unclassified Planococcus (in: firmicutes)]MBU9674578.1 polyphosphate--nucleotide phosphotransferase [Planococcus sp. CP5-4_YE]MBV0910318.1 polyphosphate--nucleotide phosphotransferase [Planococcus sp. CP5-4_UN]MBW6065169.1 polyphosphate--nucleotide phosphotransferase [Planococcus sp. CP5-4]